MKLEWMGRYRKIIGKIMRHGNVYARTYANKLIDESDITLSALEWQTLECILEYEDHFYNMTELAEKIGVPQSNFSKYVKTLVELGLVDRYRKNKNHKDIILKLTDKGRDYYKFRSNLIENEWKSVFAILDDFSDEQLEKVALFVEKLTVSFEPKECELIKLSDRH